MSLISIYNWTDLGWGKLGDSNNPEIIGFAELLKHTGLYDIKKESDYTWCKINKENVDFFRIISCISPENYTNDQIYDSIRNNKSDTESIPRKSSKDIGESAEKVRKKEEPFHKHFYEIETLIETEDYDKLPNLIKDIIAPFFFRDYPDGRIYFVVFNDLLIKIFAHIRVPYICSIHGIKVARDMSTTTGVRTYDELTGRLDNIDVFISILSSLFYPRFYFIVATRLGSCVIFQLDKPFEFNPKYPYDVFDLIRKSDVFDETVDIDLVNIPGSPEEERLAYRRFIHKRDWTATELEILVNWYIQKINLMFNKFINSANFLDRTTNCVSFIRQFNFLHTIQRILGETAIISTEKDSRVRKPLFFELLDKYASILKDRSGHNNDAEHFKTLLRLTNYESKIKPIIKGIPEPFGTYFAETFGQTLFTEIYKVITEDEYLSKSIIGNNVKLISWDNNSVSFVDRGEIVSKEDYVVNMLRTIRNTHHGYMDDPSNRFEKYLSIHSGSTPHYIADLSLLFFLSLLSDPDSLLNASWK